MCNSAGKVPENVYKDAVALTRYYMKKYHISASRVIRHWDVNGKDCPDPCRMEEIQESNFKIKVLNKVLNNISELYELNKPFLTYFYAKNGLNMI